MEAGANGLNGLLALSHAVVVFIKREPDNVTTHTKLMEDNLVLHQVARAENVEQWVFISEPLSISSLCGMN